MRPSEDELTERRREAYKAVESIYSARRATSRWPVERKEVRAYTGMNEVSSWGALRWLVKNGILSREGNGYKPNVFDPSEVCWLHGIVKRETKECPRCIRSQRWKK